MRNTAFDRGRIAAGIAQWRRDANRGWVGGRFPAQVVIPAKAGIQNLGRCGSIDMVSRLDSRLRGNDG
ncbi:hypothetical protein [Sphingomonas sp. DC1100-1]|uniref:hypothetical protein n=1 Tax=unclassified Sphingomonas TaxID=196159 RepID=UPI003CEA4776